MSFTKEELIEALESDAAILMEAYLLSSAYLLIGPNNPGIMGLFETYVKEKEFEKAARTMLPTGNYLLSTREMFSDNGKWFNTEIKLYGATLRSPIKTVRGLAPTVACSIAAACLQIGEER
jgi:hypothetical protein